MTKTHYLPWKGEKYEKGNIFGKRIMILGESHYGKVHSTTNNTTSVVIEESIFKGLYNTRFLRMVPPAILGLNSVNAITQEQRKEFWHNVLFYNYIQETVNSGPRGKRTMEQWSKSEDAFYEVINQYKPEYIFAFGYDLGANLPRVNSKTIDGLRGIEYTLNDGSKSIVAIVKHPAGGMSYKEVHKVIDKLGL